MTSCRVFWLSILYCEFLFVKCGTFVDESRNGSHDNLRILGDSLCKDSKETKRNESRIIENVKTLKNWVGSPEDMYGAMTDDTSTQAVNFSLHTGDREDMEVVWWLFLFVMLAVTADEFFCPSLVVIAKTLHMSDNIAGVTLLALGNGSPDVFSAIAAIGSMKNGDAGLAIGALFGAGLFVTCVVAGTVTITKPFHAMERPFLRDVIFYIFAVFFTFFILYDHEITLLEAVGYIGLYSIYVLVVVIGRYIYQRHRQSLRLQQQDEACPEQGDEIPQIASATTGSLQHRQTEDTIRPTRALNSLVVSAETVGVSATFGDEILINPDLHQSVSSSEASTGSTELTPLLQNTEDVVHHSAIKDFITAISPLKGSTWRNKRWYSKLYTFFKAPSYFMLLVIIPVVDQDEEGQKWNRHLRCLNCILGPVIAILATKPKVALYMLGDILPVWALVLLIGSVLAVVVYITSKNEEPPVYHWVFAFVGFLIALICISTIAKEIVNLLQTLGVVFNISDAILGLTLMAWGNSIGDLVADLSMARQGFPRAAISACFGGPLFNLLLGVGIPFTILCVTNGGKVKLQFTVIQVALIVSLFISLLSSLTVVPLMKFHFRRGYGFYLCALYVVFVIFAVLIESGIITGSV